MNRMLVIVNRGLYGVAILAAAGLAAALGGEQTQTAAPASPLQLPAITVPPYAQSPELVFPSRNVFDPDGTAWLPAPPPGAEVKAKAPEAPIALARGIIQLPGVEGVLTDSGFVGTGETLPEGKLKRVVDNGYVVASATGDHEVPFDVDRARRIDELFHPSAPLSAVAEKPPAKEAANTNNSAPAPQNSAPAAAPRRPVLPQQHFASPLAGGRQLVKPQSMPQFLPPGQQIQAQQPAPGQQPGALPPGVRPPPSNGIGQ